MSGLTRQQKERLDSLLLKTFPSWTALSGLTWYGLALNLSEITGDSAGLQAAVLTLIMWAESHGKLLELISAACDRNSDPNLRSFAQEVGAVAPRSESPSTASLTWPAQLLPTLVGRDDLFSEIKRRLLTGGVSAQIALIGKPGVGKTALATALRNDPEVVEHFRDGILRAELGRDTGKDRMISQLSSWGRELSMSPDEMMGLTSVESWSDAIQAKIGIRRILFVIEDLWPPSSSSLPNETLLAFRLGGPNCARIITTRFIRVALRYTEDVPIKVPELDETAGLALLRTRVPQVIEAEPEKARSLVKVVGGLPLAIVLIANYLRDAVFDERRSPLQKALDKLGSLEARFALSDPQAPGERHPSLSPDASISLNASIELSYHVLDEPARDAFKTLSIFPPKPNSFSEESALTACGTSTAELDRLYECGLLEAVGGWSDRYSLHQTIQEYASMIADPADQRPHARLAEHFSGLLSPYARPFAQFSRETLADIEADEENIKMVLNWCSSNHMLKTFVSLTLGFCSYLGSISRWQEAIERGTRAAAAAGEIDDCWAQAHAYCHVIAWPLWMRGDYQQAREACRKGITAAGKVAGVDNQVYLCIGTHNLYRTALQQCQNTNNNKLRARYIKELKQFGHQCLQAAKQSEGSELHEALLGLAYSDLGYTAMKFGKYAEAEKWFRERLSLVERSSKPSQVQIAGRKLDVALALLGQRDFESSQQLLDEAAHIGEAQRRDDIQAEILFALAILARETGDRTRAGSFETEARAKWSLNREPFAFILNKPEIDPG